MKVFKMNNKIKLACIMISLNLFLMKGQDTSKFVTVYWNGLVEKTEQEPVGVRYNVNAFSPSISYNKEVNRLIFQFDLMPFSYSKYNYIKTYNDSNDRAVSLIDGYERKAIESSFGLITKYRFVNFDLIKINLSLENRLFFRYFYNQPYTSQLFNSSNKKLGWDLILGFELEKLISKKIIIAIMPSYFINEYFYNVDYVENPIIPEDLRTNSDFINNFNPNKMIIRFGLKIKI